VITLDSNVQVPADELARFEQLIRTQPEYLDPDFVKTSYSGRCMELVDDPYAVQLVELISEAIRNKKAFSVTRWGDGEMNLLTFGLYPGFDNLDRYSVQRIVGLQRDRFRVDDTWSERLREMMNASLTGSDIAGVLGLWRPRHLGLEDFIGRFRRDHRGFGGYWRGVQHMVRLAHESVFENKVVGSAHLYLAMVKHIQDLVRDAGTVFLLNDHADTGELFRRHFRAVDFEVLRFGTIDRLRQRMHRSEPEFLWSMRRMLPSEMTGTLTLVGAGPWAEIYCHWIKERGGVAVDVGSGLDLLRGQVTRGIHKRLGLDNDNPYRL
jgi:hypothetical protein